MARPNNINLAPGGGGGGGARGIRSAAGKGAVKPSIKKKLAEPSKASVKVKPKPTPKPKPKSVSNTAPKTGLENRGVKLTRNERINRAREYQWQKLETRMEQRFDTNAGGPRAGEINTAGPGKANARKAAAVAKEASKKFITKKPPKKVIKIKSN